MSKPGRYRVLSDTHCWKEAVCWYRKASEHLSPTQAYAERAEVYAHWAQALEEMGYEQEAFDL